MPFHSEPSTSPNDNRTGATSGEQKLLIFGGSGHAKDVVEVARSLGYTCFEIVTTDGSCDLPRAVAIKESDFDPQQYLAWDSFVAIGNNTHRRRFLENYQELRFTSIIAPSATVSVDASIDVGCYVGAHVYLGPESRLERGCIVNTGAIVGHDSVIDKYSQVGPQVCISGNVHIGESVQIGAGALFNNGSPKEPLSVANEVIIGMGCHITASIKQEGIQIIPRPNHISVRPS